jgi:hypothetical protein
LRDSFVWKQDSCDIKARKKRNESMKMQFAYPQNTRRQEADLQTGREDRAIECTALPKADLKNRMRIGR